ncbi:hypothetical protein EDD86DRAFT_203777 [Gorgonomyces haynaldii]|nr:hypothetical protein EDD86DRAFT_203777 [Gorgonomyces haynaldii]
MPVTCNLHGKQSLHQETVQLTFRPIWITVVTIVMNVGLILGAEVSFSMTSNPKEQTVRFSADKLARKLKNLESTQVSIQATANWMVYYYMYYTQQVALWKKTVRESTPDKVLPLFYLANEVIQTSTRKGPSFVNEFKSALIVLLPDLIDKGNQETKAGILETLKVWKERGVYDADFIKKLAGSHIMEAQKKLPVPEVMAPIVKAATELEAFKKSHETITLAVNGVRQSIFEDRHAQMTEYQDAHIKYRAQLDSVLHLMTAYNKLVDQMSAVISDARQQIATMAPLQKDCTDKIEMLERRMDEAAFPPPPGSQVDAMLDRMMHFATNE